AIFLSFRFGDLIVRVDAVYVHFFMQKWGEERIFPHPNIYYRTVFCLGKMLWCCDVVMLKDRTARRQTVSLSVVGAELIFWSHGP
ncbi:hypothetical protein ACR751_03050, partial [Acidaminococcus intestini]|uniref:hypothetical protein n=1 Tax=Acidaminococcus intestini TaxID=187327 RepID=UPI003DA620CD